MRRIIRSGEIRSVTGEAIRRCARENIVDVARRAWQRGMGSSERVSSELEMVELRVEP